MLENTWFKATASGPNGNCLEVFWQKATASNGSGGNNCVEARLDNEQIKVRDSKDNGTGPVLSFTRDEWTAFLDGATKGEFDLPA